ncbi:uncharacterized protein LOC142589729 [Dermacentor variabilis]|uniref:uncharacterized protein LOC142589729 n=1 Tax=Dermacentor variabilis TaxID=34621 RepID=UPI003F5B412E
MMSKPTAIWSFALFLLLTSKNVKGQCTETQLPNVLALGTCLGLTPDYCLDRPENATVEVIRIFTCVFRMMPQVRGPIQSLFYLRALTAGLLSRAKSDVNPIAVSNMLCNPFGLPLFRCDNGLPGPVTCGPPIKISLPTSFGISDCINSSRLVCLEGETLRNETMTELIDFLACVFEGAPENLRPRLARSLACPLVQLLRLALKQFAEVITWPLFAEQVRDSVEQLATLLLHLAKCQSEMATITSGSASSITTTLPSSTTRISSATATVMSSADSPYNTPTSNSTSTNTRLFTTNSSEATTVSSNTTNMTGDRTGTTISSASESNTTSPNQTPLSTALSSTRTQESSSIVPTYSETTNSKTASATATSRQGGLPTTNIGTPTTSARTMNFSAISQRTSTGPPDGNAVTTSATLTTRGSSLTTVSRYNLTTTTGETTEPPNSNTPIRVTTIFTTSNIPTCYTVSVPSDNSSINGTSMTEGQTISRTTTASNSSPGASSDGTSFWPSLPSSSNTFNPKTSSTVSDQSSANNSTPVTTSTARSTNMTSFMTVSSVTSTASLSTSATTMQGSNETTERTSVVSTAVTSASPSTGSSASCVNVTLPNLFGLDTCLGRTLDACPTDNDVYEIAGSVVTCTIRVLSTSLSLQCVLAAVKDIIVVAFRRFSSEGDDSLASVLSPFTCNNMALGGLFCSGNLSLTFPRRFAKCMNGSTEVCRGQEPIQEFLVSSLMNQVKCILLTIVGDAPTSVLSEILCEVSSVLAEKVRQLPYFGFLRRLLKPVLNILRRTVGCECHSVVERAKTLE